jgi:hypothetical protein
MSAASCLAAPKKAPPCPYRDLPPGPKGGRSPLAPHEPQRNPVGLCGSLAMDGRGAWVWPTRVGSTLSERAEVAHTGNLAAANLGGRQAPTCIQAPFQCLRCADRGKTTSDLVACPTKGQRLSGHAAARTEAMLSARRFHSSD